MELPDKREEYEVLRDELNDIYEMLTNEKTREYGESSITLGRIANYWNTYLSNLNKLKHPLTKKDICFLMALLKLARLNFNDKSDSYKDLIGYILLAERADGTTGKI